MASSPSPDNQPSSLDTNVDLKELPGFAEDLKRSIHKLEKDIDGLEKTLARCKILLKLKLIDREINSLSEHKCMLVERLKDLD